MSEQPIQLSAGRLPETIIATYDEEAITALSQALAAPENEKKQRVAGVAATWPRHLDAWVALGQLSTEPIERYAYFRVGYHRGLDTLRASGWKGSGYVRWVHESNQGFLRALRGLALSAQAIGETDEADRCAQFLGQLDPSGVPETE